MVKKSREIDNLKVTVTVTIPKSLDISVFFWNRKEISAEQIEPFACQILKSEDSE